MSKHVVIGANGNAGNAIVDRLIELGEDVITITRSGKLINNKVSQVKMIKGDINELDTIIEQLENVDYIYNAVNPPYHKWKKYLYNYTDNFIRLTEETGARLLVVDNLYMYNEDNISNMTETSPTTVTTRKGKIRAEIAKKYLDANKEGRIKMVILRGSDFYGPAVRNSVFGERTISGLIKRNKAMLFGKSDKKHSFTYIPDFAEAAVKLIMDTEIDGDIFHAPVAPAITQEQMIELFGSSLGYKPKYFIMPKLMLTFIGLFDPIVREFKEMLYQFENEFVVSDTKYREKYGIHATPLQDGISETLDWFKKYNHS